MRNDIKKWELIIAIISIVLSAVAIIVSLYTHFDNKKLEERIRYEDRLSQRIEDSRVLRFNNNTEFWDYSIDSILEDMISKNGLTDELEEISFYIADKQRGSALNCILENEKTLSKYDKFYLLKACIQVRDYIMDDEFLTGRYHVIPISKDDISKCTTIKDEKYTIVLGILNYYSDDIAGAARYLRNARDMYSKDSPFYDITNYWLALISIRLRSNICDVKTFLISTYNDTKILSLMKSSIAFLFEKYIDDFPGNLPFILCRDQEGTYYNSYYVPKPVVNVSKYLCDTDKELISDLGSWGDQKNLFSFYDLIYRYSQYLHSKGNFISAPIDAFERQNPELINLIDSSTCDEVFFLDPRVVDEEYDAKFEHWFMFYSFGLRNYGIDNIVPVDDFFNRLVLLSDIHSTEERDYVSYAFSYAYEYWLNLYFNQNDLDWEKALYATMALKYSPYVAPDERFDKGEAALIAYDYGYRYEYIMNSLLEYYEKIGDYSKIENIEYEKSIYCM